MHVETLAHKTNEQYNKKCEKVNSQQHQQTNKINPLTTNAQKYFATQLQPYLTAEIYTSLSFSFFHELVMPKSTF